MPNLLRDQYIKNITVTKETLQQINTILTMHLADFNKEIQDISKKAFITYIIRFDEKGYKLFNFDELLQYFESAKEIERVWFTLENGESLASQRRVGFFTELKLDQSSLNDCFLTVAADDFKLVELIFSSLKETLEKYKNKNGLFQTVWTLILVQILGVISGFCISFWAAIKISPYVKNQNSFIIVFLFFLLICSNTWGHIYKRIISFLNGFFPNLKFYRPEKDKTHWIGQTVVGSSVFAFLVWILNLLFNYMGKVFGAFI